MTKSSNNQLLGISWMLLHCLLISLVVTIAKALGQMGFDPIQVVFLHSFVAFLVLLPISVIREGKNILKTKKFHLHFARGFLGVVSLYLYFYALKFIPLNEGRAIALFSPVITFIFAIIFLKEKLDIKKSAALILSLLGGYIIIGPSDASFHMMFLFILLAMIMWSCTDLILKSLSKTESNLKQIFYLTGLLSFLSFPFALQNWSTPTTQLEIILTISIGLIFLANSIAIFLAIKHADLTTVMPFDFSGMIFTAIISFFSFHEIIHLNTFIGALIIFLSSLYLIYHENRSTKNLMKTSRYNVEKE